MQLALFIVGLLFANAAANEHFRKAQAYAGQQNWTLAIQEYRLGLELDPRSSDAHNNLGAVYFQSGDYQRAASSFASAARLKPGDPDLEFNIGLTLVRLMRPSDALPHLLVARASKMNAAEAHFLVGLCYYSSHRWSDAAGAFRSAHNSGKRDPELLYLLVRANKNAGHAEEGMRALTELASIYPESAFVHELLAEAYDLAQNTRAAEVEFLKAIEKAPSEPDLHFALGYLYWKDKRFEDAARQFTEELRIQPRSAAALYYLGAITLKQNDNDVALEYFKKAQEADPEFRDLHLGLGQAYGRAGRYPEALSEFQRAVELSPDRVEAHYWLGQTLRRLERNPDAEAEFAIVRRLQAAERVRASEILDRERGR